MDLSGLPGFCRVAGTIRPTADSDIRFEVWMPLTGWNGKFVGGGNGVWAGSIAYGDMVGPLARGYAAAASDVGHQGSPVDGTFLTGHPEKLTDFGHRAVHESTVAAKAAIAKFYGEGPQRSLYASCSTGGRIGLMEAYRYPEDYDAISAIAPANPMVPLMVMSLWTGNATMKDDASRIPAPKFAFVQKAAMEACDADDGVRDGIIGNPPTCGFDPAMLQCKGDDAPECLTAPQVQALREIYRGPRNPRTGEQIYPGLSVGAEAQMQALTMGQEPFPVATTFFRGPVFNDPTWSFRAFDYDRDVERAKSLRQRCARCAADRSRPFRRGQPQAAALARLGGRSHPRPVDGEFLRCARERRRRAPCARQRAALHGAGHDALCGGCGAVRDRLSRHDRPLGGDGASAGAARRR
jgi:hypothetical protein